MWEEPPAPVRGQQQQPWVGTLPSFRSTGDVCKFPEPGMALALHALCTVTNPFVVLMRFEVFGWEVYKLQIWSFQTDALPGWTHGYHLAQETDQDMVEELLWGWA